PALAFDHVARRERAKFVVPDGFMLRRRVIINRNRSWCGLLALRVGLIDRRGIVDHRLLVRAFFSFGPGARVDDRRLGVTFVRIVGFRHVGRSLGGNLIGLLVGRVIDLLL